MISSIAERAEASVKMLRQVVSRLIPKLYSMGQYLIWQGKASMMP